MTRRLRPGLHYAPVANGIIFISPRRSFALTGPATLLALLDHVVPMLEDGTDVPAMVSSLGRAELRSAVESIVGSLDRHGMLLDEARLTEPAPSPSERARFAGAIAHLETIADDPNGALRRVRAARAVVRGGGPHAVSATEALVNAGFGAVSLDHPPGPQPEPLGEVPLPAARAVAGVDGAQLEIAVFVAGGDGAGRTTMTVPVRWTGTVLLCGPVLAGEDDHDRHEALLRRVADWAGGERLDGASRPLGPMLAAAYAAHAAFEWVGLGPGAPSAHVVHSALEADQIVLGPPPTSRLPSPPSAHGSSRTPAAAVAPSESAAAEIAHAAEAVTVALPLLARWSGLARWDMPGDLAQIPVAITVLAGRDRSIPKRILGWGATEAHASLDAMLGLLRCAAGAEDGPGIAAAGRVESDGILDGVLRLLVADLDVIEPFDTSRLDIEGRRRWRTLTGGDGIDANLVLARLAGSALALAEVRGPDGTTLAAQWGIGAAAATSALGAAIAAHRTRATGGPPCATCDPTSAVLVQRPELVDPVGQAARRWLGVHDRGVRSAQRRPDRVVGALPLWSGRVWFT